MSEDKETENEEIILDNTEQTDSSSETAEKTSEASAESGEKSSPKIKITFVFPCLIFIST